MKRKGLTLATLLVGFALVGLFVFTQWRWVLPVALCFLIAGMVVPGA